MAAAAGAMAMAPAAFAGPAGHRQGPSINRFDGTYHSTTYTYTTLRDPAGKVSPAELGPNGSVTFSTTIKTGPNAAMWDDNTAQLIIAGLVKAHPGTSKLEQSGSVLYAQDNSNGSGYCTNDQFLTSSGRFVFGDGAQCYVHSGSPGSTETYTVTLNGDNTFSDTVTGYGSNGVAQFHATFTGTLSNPATTRYYPAVYLLPGRCTAATSADPGCTASPHSVATFTVSHTSYDGPPPNGAYNGRGH